jgi:hypothetical protein
MSLKNSLNQSDQHNKKKKSRQKRLSERDLPLKLGAARAFTCQDYLVKVNLGLSEPPTGQIEKQVLIDITDIDVMAIKHHDDFTPFVICMSCKGGRAKNLSAIKESFYLKGVMDYFGGNRGYVVISDKPVLSHARMLATKLDIIVLQGREFDDWCKIAQDGCEFDYSDFWKRDTFDTYIEDFTRIQQVEPLRSYLSVDYWFYKDFRNVQNIIAYTKKAKEYLTKESLPVRLVILETALHLSLSILELCRYVTSVGVKDIQNHIGAYLFGGVTFLRSRQNLYKQVDTLLKSKGMIDNGGPQLPSLLPEYTSSLVELVYRWITKPWAAIRVPQIIQFHLWRSVLSSMGISGKEERKDRDFDEISLKFADDLLEFIASSTDVRREHIL